MCIFYAHAHVCTMTCTRSSQYMWDSRTRDVLVMLTEQNRTYQELNMIDGTW